MTKKIVTCVLLLLLVLGVQESKAQLGRSDWYCGPVFQTDNFIYNGIGTLMVQMPVASFDGAEEFFVKNQWWIPQFRYRANVVQKMEFDSGEASIRPRAWGFSRIDWVMRNFSIGYKVGFTSRIFPLGFEFAADYVQDGYKVKMPWSEEKHSMIKRMISTTALAKIRLLSYEMNWINPILEIGGAYNYALHYHDGFVNDKDAVNNGFTGIIGIGFINTGSHVSWSLRYEHSFYDFHNEDYEHNGVKIFSGSKSTFGRLGASFSYSF